jgi:arsenate reductase
VASWPVRPAPSVEYNRIVDDLTYRYDGVFSRETVQRAVDQARATLGPVAKFPNFLPILTERFPRDQLLAAAQVLSVASLDDDGAVVGEDVLS